MSASETLGDRAKKVRDEHGLSQGKMADLLNISLRNWQMMERDEGVPSGDTLLRFAGLGLNPGWVLTGIGPKHLEGVNAPKDESEALGSSQPAAINPAIFKAVKQLVRTINEEAGIRLPDEARDEEAVRRYNDLVALARGSTDEGKLRSLLPALEYEITESVKSAVAEPGTGKRSA